jgi:hypothetical protein
VDTTLNNQSSSDIRAIEQKAAQDHKDAEEARSAVQDILLQRLAQSIRHSKNDKNE